MSKDAEEKGITVESLQMLDREHHLHPFTAASALRASPPFLMEKASGCYVTGQGFQLLDMMAGLGCVNVGYGRKEMVAAVSASMEQLSYYHSFSAVSNPMAAMLSGVIAEVAPEGMNKVLFANSGSEANESALKVIRFYWHKRGKPKKKIILTREYAYHGSTIVTTAMNGNKAMQEPYGLEGYEGIEHVPSTYWYRDGGDLTPEDHGQQALEALEAKILDLGPENISAFFVEAIQATMGAVMPSEGYLPGVERLCRKYDILLVADEVVTGLGRTGNWFAQETFGFRADIMTLAKGLSSGYVPISAVVLHDDISSVIEAGEDIFQHGFTTSAHPVMAAVALSNINILKQEKLIERIRDDIGPYFKESLKILESHPLVGEVRVCGLIAGIELVRDKATREQYPRELAICDHTAQAALVQGLIVRPTGNNIVVCPPFIVTKPEIDLTVQVLEKALTQVYKALNDIN